jgi:hypothetical protein
LYKAKASVFNQEVFQSMCDVIHARYYKVESTS